MNKIAIMQPYFVPYAGYFRLMQFADIFVIYDCVQFPRRGYVHRNKLHFQHDQLNWLNLPLLKQGRDVLINQLKFKHDALEIFKTTLKKSNVFLKIKDESILLDALYNFSQTPNQYISSLLKFFCKQLNINTKFLHSSQLELSPKLKGQYRIIEICKQFNANQYINSPNGRLLYQKSSFEKEGIELMFLEDYEGESVSILENYYIKNSEERKVLSEDIKKQSVCL